MGVRQTFSRPETGRVASRVLEAELLSALKHAAQSQTEFMERLGGQIVNNTLQVFSGVFDATGFVTAQWKVAAGSIYVNNLGVAGHRITVSSGSPGASVPSGTGTFLVDGGTARTVPLASHNVTLWGTAGDAFSFAVFTAAVRPGTA
jgi:hypothetical protein